MVRWHSPTPLECPPSGFLSLARPSDPPPTKGPPSFLGPLPLPEDSCNPS